MARLLDALSDRVLEFGPARDATAEGHWRVATDSDYVTWLVLDRHDKPVNTIDRAVMEELNAHLDRIEERRPSAVVIRSAKPSGFALGADINQFVGAERDAIMRMIGDAHGVLDRLAALKVKTIAVIHGQCLGGGLELALACDTRIATPDAKLGFPEVMLGLHPGLGGTYRSTAVADPIQAMTMMLTGKSMPAKKARAIGLVDAIAEERHVLGAVEAARRGEVAPKGHDFKASAMASLPGRKLAARQMRQQTAAKAPKAHYPAPYALIDLWEAHGGDPRAMQKAETESFADLLVGATAQNLVRVFFLRETMRGLRSGKSGIRNVHVIGAGAMGGEIAAWAAREGFSVTLQDVKAAPIGKAMKAADKMLSATLRDPLKVRDALDRLMPDMDGLGVGRADLVIEAAPERLDVKRAIYAEVEPKLKDGALLATNTSALPLDDLAQGLADPSRFVGLHFFNPVSRMQLVEIVRHQRLAPETERRATAFAVEISRLPAPVASAPGFLVNRCLTPYMAEALIMLDEGVPAEKIDAVAEDFGMPMGPIELTDRVGLDIAMEVSSSLRERLDTAFPDSPAWLAEKVEEGKLGYKTGAGLYEYDGEGKPKKRKIDAIPDGQKSGLKSDQDYLDRMLLPMLNAVVACLREGVVDSEDVADGAMIFGTGFAPFRGGPLHYARSRGVDEIVAKLRTLAGEHGARFEPDAGWDRLKVEKG